MSEYCVCCGEEIPEGRMVCPLCTNKAEQEEPNQGKKDDQEDKG